MTATVIARHKRIAIRPTREDDMEYVLAAEAAPENAQGILPWTRTEHLAVASDPDNGHWIIEAKPDERPVGFMILRGLQGPDKAIELKRILVTEKGSGFGREAIQLAKKMAFHSLGAHRLWLDVFTDNQRARRLYESEGFVKEGILRECHLAEQRYRSLVILSLLESEYRT